MQKVKDYLKLIRIKHYIKNVLILLPLFFSGKIFNTELYKSAILGFICFSFISSAIYILNDIHDIKDDKKHPVKKNRPLASERISIRSAITVALILILIVALVNLMYLNYNYSFIYLIVYFILNICYSFKLKNVPIFDIAILSFGFLIRVLYGGSLLNIEVSNWLFLTILSGALFMSIGKRRNELIKNGNNSRKVLLFYTKEFLDKNLYVFLSMTLVFFSLWALEQNNDYFIWIIPIIVLICLRYSFDIERDDSYGDPVDVILGDKTLLYLGVLIIILMTCLMYLTI